jgi:hypothetical protein
VAAAAAAPAPAADREVFRLAAPVVVAGKRSFDFRLPEGARQGSDAWYLIRLRYRLTFARESGPGLAWVIGDTNGRTSAQVEYTVARRSGGLRVRRTSVDLVNGQLARTFASRTDSVTFTNYLQLEGVRGGENELRIRLEESGLTRVERLELLPGTAIVRTGRSPYPLALEARLLDERVRAGEAFRVGVTVSNRTGERLRDVVVRPQHAFELVSDPGLRFATLRRPAYGVYVFRAGAPGEYELGFVADSSRNHPSLGLRVVVLERRSFSTLDAAIWAVALLPFALVGGWVIRSRRGRR